MGRRVLLLLSFAGCVVAGAVAGDQIEARKSELEAVKSSLESLRREISQAETEKDREARELRALEKRIGTISHRIRELDRERQTRARHLQGLEGERRRHQAEADAHAKVLARQVRASHALGRQERLKFLLNQQDPVRIGRMLAYYDYFQRQRLAQMDAVREALRGLADTEANIRSEQARLEALLVDERTARASLERAQSERREVVASLDEDIRQRGEEVSRLRRDEARLKQLVERLGQVQERLAALQEIEAEAAAEEQAGPFGARRGELAWPAPGRIRSGFGSSKGAGLAWDGVVINAPAGHEVTTVHAGRVVFADWLKGYGLLLIVDHGDGYMSLYGYNQSLFKSVGEWVGVGDVIAIVGNSGGQLDPALYFGIRHNGKPVDPARWCRGISGNRTGMRNGAGRRFFDVA